MKNVEYIRRLKIFIILFIIILLTIFQIIFLKRINYFQPYIFNCHNGNIQTLFFKGKIQTNNYFFKMEIQLLLFPILKIIDIILKHLKNLEKKY